MKLLKKVSKKKIIILATEGLSTNLLYHSLKKNFIIDSVIIEEKISRKVLLKNRIKKLGPLKVLNQILFIGLIQPMLSFLSKNKINSLLTASNLEDNPIPNNLISMINSVNNPILTSLIKNDVDYIFVNGTRIISNELIQLINIPMINIHAGITPKYRGVHGGYWAVRNNDFENCGTTLHFIDSGIDTGNIIGQKNITLDSNDNFCTYPIKQLITGIELVNLNLAAINSNKFNSIKPRISESKLFYHPGLFDYLYFRIFKGVK